MELRIQLFGGFRLSEGAGSSAALGCRKAQELLGYLLLVGGQARSRETATESIWPDTKPDAGRKKMRQALWNIHQTVDPDGGGERLVLSVGDTLLVNPQRDCWCDAVEFARAIDGHLARPPDPVLDLQLDAALDLHTGALLDGCFSDWCLIERERLDTLQVLGLDEAAGRAELRGDRWRAVAWSNTLLGIDPAHERTHRRLMRLHCAAADRTRALQQFERCRRVLELELGIQPSSRTVELFYAIRDDVDASALAQVPAPDHGVGPEGSSGGASIEHQLAEIRCRLDSLSRTLGRQN